MGSPSIPGPDEDAQNRQAAIQSQQLELANMASSAMNTELDLLLQQLALQGQVADAEAASLDVVADSLQQGETELSELLRVASSEQQRQSQRIAVEAERAQVAQQDEFENLMTQFGLANARARYND